MTERVMIVFTVPPEHLDAVLNAMAEAGAGVVGHYTHCAFVSSGTGYFRPTAAANPAYGQREQINQVPEVRVESFCPRERAQTVAAAIRQAHPYEEVVLYLLPLLDETEG
jgi:hypothetical protein